MHINPNEIIEQGYLAVSPYTTVEQVGIDLSIEKNVDLKGNYEVVRLNEQFNLPSDIFAILFPRSTLIRKGFVIQCGVIEPGYAGRPVVAIHGSGFLPKGYRVVQAVFFVGSPASVYNGRYQYEGL